MPSRPPRRSDPLCPARPHRGGSSAVRGRTATTLAAGLALGALALAAARPAPAIGAPAAEDAVDFARDVRPLLSAKCFACHGPDAAAREADLRLDRREDVIRDRGGYRVVEPGDRATSELWARLHDADDPMPPRTSEKQLTAEERTLLGRWIDAGAHYAEHWSFVAPVRPPIPAVADEGWARNPVDRFVLARLEAAGLRPSPPADRATLLRRVHLDLTGLPPDPTALAAFLADERPDAYERVVDALLASPHHAEALARAWLDAARYADTHGFHIDNERGIWPWRDWVIDAFARNRPFDQFVREQLAGDLLPGPEGAGPSLAQRIATGFLRCNPTTGEGGLIEEEWLVRYAADRVETTATVFLGLTMQCAQCHDHKFDPITQEDYYRFFGFFHDLAEEGTDRNAYAPPPAVRAPDAESARALAALDERIAARAVELEAEDPALDASQAAWEAELGATLAARWTPLEPTALASDGGTLLAHVGGGVVVASGPEPDVERYVLEGTTTRSSVTGLRLDALVAEGAPGVGRAVHGNIVLSEVRISVAPLGGDEPDWETVPLVAAEADHSQDGFDVALALDGDPATGWALAPRAHEPHTARFAALEPGGHAGGSRVRVELVFASRFPRHALARFRLALGTDPATLATALGPWERSAPFVADDFDTAYATPRGPEPGAPAGEAVGWVALADAPPDGRPLTLTGANTATYLRRTLVAPTARTLHLALGSDDAVKLWLDGQPVHANRALRPWAADQDRVALELAAGEHELLVKVVNAGGGYAFSLRRTSESEDGLPLDVAAALGSAADRRDDTQRARLRAHYRRSHSAAFRAAEADLQVARAERDALLETVPLTMVAASNAERRPTYFLERGDYRLKRHEVLPGTPGALPALVPRGGPDAVADRLDLADWLLADENPLTARVTVNRLWAFVFGAGLVRTSEDFGAQGTFPTHPALLDWLAVELRTGGWDVRALLRLLVTSSTYRQASAPSAELLAVDPHDRLLARWPRHRLDAEELRDAALAASGLLVRTVGGPSVRPYQPEGLWRAVSYPSSNTSTFRADEGDALYRRSMYTFWKRTSPPPVMTLFDAPNREACVVRRARTNTPLQALALLNETGFVEAARALAARALRKAGGDGQRDDVAVARHAFELALTRTPDAPELEVLLAVLTGARADVAARPDAARALLAVGASPPQDDLDPLELAAWTHVTNLILNLDEFVTQR